MREGTDLVAEQAGRFGAIDPLLPVITDPPEGETLVATLPDGGRVTGVLRVTFTDPAAPEALWSALEVWELTPIVGERGTEGMDAVLRACRARLDAERPGEDSACLVSWPSRDAEGTRALLDHGLVPLWALGVRTAEPPEAPGSPDVRVREAGPGDVETILRLERAEVEYSAQAGNLRARTGWEHRRRESLREQLAGDSSGWLAELDGEPVGVVEGGMVTVEEGTWLGTVLPAGRWGYVHSAAVLPAIRGRGVGRALLAAAHARLATDDARGTYLYYNPLNPLASVFWHRQGYRPLWTVWEVRPASMLR
ncbi:GNAT family N-acetyltransferase [Prauserella cavernicola]|uniref:GNAT family N-acetyltransferase n=1 Tax=Prauserella cavernicola TaxID=2800127 RepID=A0A934QXX4_9PSEU|nr:GNAT family N-acetyltransferase [Prauserella cavernicola]MBK1788496.1 GNAT family N-acetyltransferase [Prauserella cavernicola]